MHLCGLDSVVARYLIPRCRNLVRILVDEVLFGVLCGEQACLLPILGRHFLNRIDHGVWNFCAIVGTVYPDVPCLNVYDCEKVVGIVRRLRLNWAAHIR